MRIEVVGPSRWRDCVIAAHRATGVDATGRDASISEVADIIRHASDDVVGIEFHPSLCSAVAGVTDLDDGLARETSVRSVVAFQPTGNARMAIGCQSLTSGIVRATRAASIELGRTAILGGRELAASALVSAVELKARSIFLAPLNSAGPGSAISAAHRLGLDVSAVRFDALIGRLDEFDSLMICGTIPQDLNAQIQDCGVPVVRVAPGEGGSVPYEAILARQIEDAQRILTGVNPDLSVIEKIVENFAT
ncbi:hypothetical protein [Arcanobacterium canis]